ncbi:hypothetical protein [Bosea psychrotolerans]|uniref:Uncharacterized protein n=1 Tax=Bosea psychrotolerans TaxID=1871628 RepID=A0A2S4MCE9_9HYPH|nr:hypothetical protein [Bosea psychrotolerans]POR52412.1 hypothetical protein CYD53_10577 [Bosea psychrotolerans]
MTLSPLIAYGLFDWAVAGVLAMGLPWAISAMLCAIPANIVMANLVTAWITGGSSALVHHAVVGRGSKRTASR